MKYFHAVMILLLAGGASVLPGSLCVGMVLSVMCLCYVMGGARNADPEAPADPSANLLPALYCLAICGGGAVNVLLLLLWGMKR